MLYRECVYLTILVIVFHCTSTFRHRDRPAYKLVAAWGVVVAALFATGVVDSMADSTAFIVFSGAALVNAGLILRQMYDFGHRRMSPIPAAIIAAGIVWCGGVLSMEHPPHSLAAVPVVLAGILHLKNMRLVYAAHELKTAGIRMGAPLFGAWGVFLLAAPLLFSAFPGYDFPFVILSIFNAGLGVVFIIVLARNKRIGFLKNRIHYDILFKHVSDVIWITDLDMHFTFASPSIEQMTGYTPRDILSTSAKALLTETSCRHCIRLAQEMMKSRSGNRESFFPARTVNLEIRTKDGGTVWAETKVQLLTNYQHEPAGFFGVSRDITERIRAEQSLRESEENLHVVQKIARIGNWELDLRTHEITWSDETYRIFNMAPHEIDLSLETLLDFVAGGDRKEVEHAIQETISGKTPLSIEHRILLRDSSEKVVHERGEIECGSNGEPIKIVGTVQDITERKLLEKQVVQAQKMESIGHLAGGVAHDFNNILTAINGNCELAMMLMESRSPAYEEMCEIHKSAKRAANLTKQLLAFSRKQIIEPRVVNLNEIIRDLEKMLGRIIGENIRLRFHLSDELWQVKIDPTQVEQLLTNLVVNAGDAIDDIGMVTVETFNMVAGDNYREKHARTYSGEYVVIAVSDNGCGMDEETRNRIFDPFFTTKGRCRGTGLGLSTCYGIVKQNNGFIWVYSEVGQGTTFKIYLPHHGSGTRESSAVPQNASFPRGKGTVLVVEDDCAVRKTVVKMLKESGYTIYIAENGEEALSLLPTVGINDINLVVTDVIMPKMGGKELAKQLRGLRPDIKILSMSGYTDNAIIQNGMIETGIDFINKPFLSHVFLEKVKSIIER